MDDRHLTIYFEMYTYTLWALFFYCVQKKITIVYSLKLEKQLDDHHTTPYTARK